MSVSPIMEWDDHVEFKDGVVWWTRLDDKYLIEVVRQGDHCALFRMFDHGDNDALVAEKEVRLAYDAQFGPDAGDVVLWQEMGLKVADERAV